MGTAEQVPLATLTTMQVGGPAERIISARSAEELLRIVAEADSRGEPVLLVGGGSNLIVADRGFPGLAVLVRNSGVIRTGERLTVAAGHCWEDVVAYAVDQKLAGIECLSGIPGLVGATPMQNVGAYGQQVSDVIVRVQAYDRSRRELRNLSPGECGFGYRSSRFKLEDGRWVVTEVEFALRSSADSEPIRYSELARALHLGGEGARSAPLEQVREAVLALRRGKGMVLDPDDRDTASAGSFFTNPVLDAEAYQRLTERAGGDVPAFPEPGERFKVPAAWLIDRAGFPKGYGNGRARLSTKHALAITNRGGATTAEILALARQIRDGVQARLGVTLANEPAIVGEVL